MKAWEQNQALQNAASNNIFYQQYTGVTTTDNFTIGSAHPSGRHSQEAAKNPEVAWLTRRVKEVSWYGDTE